MWQLAPVYPNIKSSNRKLKVVFVIVKKKENLSHDSRLSPSKYSRWVLLIISLTFFLPLDRQTSWVFYDSFWPRVENLFDWKIYGLLDGSIIRRCFSPDVTRMNKKDGFNDITEMDPTMDGIHKFIQKLQIEMLFCFSEPSKGYFYWNCLFFLYYWLILKAIKFCDIESMECLFNSSSHRWVVYMGSFFF